jgi:hypothetical protein
VNEYLLNSQQRNAISPEDLAMRILSLLQRNHRIRERGSGPYISYYPYQLSSLINFELMTREEVSFSGIEPSFKVKFAEAVQILTNGGFIVQDPTQHSSDFQIPTSKGLTVDTSAPVLGITTGEDFVRGIEAKVGTLDDVARTYLTESYRAAEENLWLSSIFMLGAASERLIYVLADHVDRLLADPAASTTLSGISKVRQRKEWIISQLPTLRKKFPAHREAFIDVEDKFDSLYNTYRYQRNEAGHPRDTPFNPDSTQAKVMLLSFGLYCQAVYAILAIP